MAAVLLGGTACTGDVARSWTSIGPLATTSMGSVVTLTAAGDALVAGLRTGDPLEVPGLQVWSDGAWRELPVRPSSPYAKLAVWQSLVADADGSLLAVGGARGGAHANVRWTVWRGSLTDGLTEQEQTFETFGGWGAGDQLGAAFTGSGPVLVGSWESARTGLDLDIWLPQANRWVRQSSAGTALESTPTAMVSGRSVAAWGAGALISGSVLHLGGDAVRQNPAVWRSSAGATGWIRIDLPDGGGAGEATGAVCSDEGCAVEGVVDGRLAIWRVDPTGAARRLDGIPSVALGEADAMPAPVSVEGRVALLVTDHDDLANSVVIREDGSGWSRSPGPRGAAVAFAAVGDTLYAVCSHGDEPHVMWSRRA